MVIKMEIKKYIKKNKLGLSLLLLFFIFLIGSLILINIFPYLYPVSIFFVVLIFIFSQYFDFEYRYFIGFALILLIICPFLLIFKLNILAEYFANYVYGFLVLGVIGYFLDNFREKIRLKGYFKIYRRVFLSILICVIIGSVGFLVYKNYISEKGFTLFIRDGVMRIEEITKNRYLKTFNKKAYYSKEKYVKVGETEIEEDIVINIDYPKEGDLISGKIDIKGWAIEKNSNTNTGIDKIEVFLDGRPWEGKFIGEYSRLKYKGEQETIKYIERLYLLYYNRRPFNSENNYWAINLESGNISCYDFAINIINNSGFLNKNLSEEEFITKLYKGLFGRDVDEQGLLYWSDQMKGNLSREEILFNLINSEEFKIRSDSYYQNVPNKDIELSEVRNDVSEVYGKQFFLSGFEIEFNSKKVKSGDHLLYIYAHSPIFGWDYKIINIYVEN